MLKPEIRPGPRRKKSRMGGEASRMAKRMPFSMGVPAISSQVQVMLSPGIAICTSLPSELTMPSILPVTSAGSEVEHGHVAGHHRVGSAALVLLGEVDVGLELGVGLGGTWRADHLATEHSILVDTTAQHADRVACRALREVGVEHADSGDDGLLGLLAAAQDLDLIALLDDSPARTRPVHTVPRPEMENTSSTGQQEGLVRLALRGGDVLVHGLHELKDLVNPLVITLVWQSHPFTAGTTLCRP